MSDDGVLFTTRMKNATRKIHSVSDALVNAKFAISLRNEEVWAGGLFVFYHIFAYLEDATKRLNDEDLKKLFVHEILYRKKAFEEDLVHYMGDDWQTSIITPLAVHDYIDHLHNLEKKNPKLLLAYVYHLYLGLLSGGQILAKKKQVFGEKNQEEATIYKDKVTDFSNANIGQLKKEVRQAMNEIAEKMTKEELEALIEESNKVFVLNNMIVNSVGGQNKVFYNILLKFGIVLLVSWLLLFFMYK